MDNSIYLILLILWVLWAEWRILRVSAMSKTHSAWISSQDSLNRAFLKLHGEAAKNALKNAHIINELVSYKDDGK